MEAQLQALIDKEAIRDLVMTYCRAADRKDHELMRTLYHEDAEEDHGGFFSGPAMRFIDMLPEIQAPMDLLHHNITTLSIRLDGDHAEGEAYVIAVHRAKTAIGQIDLLVGGRYLDQYARRAGVWKFAKRAILTDWANVRDPSTITLDHPMIHGALLGSADAADPSYEFFRLFPRMAR